MSTLTSFTLPLAAATAFSSEGPSWRQGPHQVAQKSTITGVVREASTTSSMKLASVASLTISPAGPPAASPIRPMPSFPSKPVLTNVSPPRWSRDATAATRPGSLDRLHDCHRREIDDHRGDAYSLQEA